MDLKVTNVFTRNWEHIDNEDYRFLVNQGGTRSSKTYSIAQMMVLKLIKGDGIVIDVVRKTMPSLRQTAMKDVFEILNNMNLYKERNHNKTESIYTLGKNEICFFGVDDEQKVRGRKRTYLWLNEANEIPYDVFQQLNFRTTGKIVLDYNPSDEFHWIYERVMGREDTKFIKSTYKDNPFLPEAQVKEIERLKETDENYWRVYGLGERGHSSATIYTNWDLCDRMPDEGETVYGIDFGYNAPSTITKVTCLDDEYYVKELLYERGLTNEDLIGKAKELIDNKNDYVYCDSAEPARIDEFEKAGFNVYFADKSIKDGIDFIKRKKLHIHEDSENLIKELRAYKWKQDRNENVLDEPVGKDDHAVDAMRYGIYTHWKGQEVGFW